MPNVYVTVQGDTWDFIAFKVYQDLGRELLTTELIDANPSYIHTVIFPAGIRLVIPEAYIPAAKTLPPWMR